MTIQPVECGCSYETPSMAGYEGTGIAQGEACNYFRCQSCGRQFARPVEDQERRQVMADKPTSETRKVSCLGCDKQINPKYTLCAACAEDMGYGRRAR